MKTRIVANVLTSVKPQRFIRTLLKFFIFVIILRRNTEISIDHRYNIASFRPLFLFPGPTIQQRNQLELQHVSRCFPRLYTILDGIRSAGFARGDE